MDCLATESGLLGTRLFYTVIPFPSELVTGLTNHDLSSLSWLTFHVYMASRLTLNPLHEGRDPVSCFSLPMLSGLVS